MKTQGMSWLIKTGQVLLLTLLVSVCMNGGWLNPGASHAAVTWQATGAVAQGTGALTVAWPAHQADDVALLFVETPNVATSLTTPAGFVEVTNSPQATGTANAAGGTRLTVYWARATSAAMANPVLAAVANHQIAVIVTFRGAIASGNPFDATAGSVKTPASATTTFPTVTTTAANNLIVLAAAVDLPAASTTVFSAFTNAALTGITERFDQSIATGVGGGLGIATAVKATSGATGTSSVTVTSTISTQMTISLVGAAIVSCADCHGYKSPLTFIDNATTRDAATGTFRGSHNLHVQGAGMLCSACHIIPAGETSASYKHSNGNVQIAAAIAGGTYGKASFPTANSFTPSACSNTTCHGTAASPTWGNNTTNDTCTKCHGTPTASPASVLKQAPTTPAAAAHYTHMSTAYTLKIAKRITTCSECHENVVALNTAGHMNGTKTISYNGPISTAQSTIPTNTLAGCSTTWCHGGNTTLIPQNSPARTAPVWGTTFGTTSVLGTGGAAGTSGTGRCAQCHGYPPRNAQHAGKTLAGATGCFNCHPHMTSTGTFSNPNLHINGIIEGGGDCTGCHDTGGTGLGANRLAITPQFGSGYSHHYQGAAAVDGKVCYACHWESSNTGSTTAAHAGAPGGTVDLVIWNATTRPATQTDGVTSVSYTSGGATTTAIAERAKINSHCVGYHSDLNKTTQPFSASGDTKTPAQYAWDAQSIGAKWLSTTTTAWGKFSGNFTNSKNTQTKAFSAHNNAANNARGWNTLAENLQGTAAVTNYPNTSGATAVPCFDCHNSHGSDLTGLVATTSYDSVIAKKGGILKQTTAGKGGYSQAYKPNASGSAGEKNQHNAGAGLCFDCHNNAAANATTISGSTTPWGYGIYGATQAIIGYNDTPYFGRTGGVFPKTLTYTYTTLTGNTGTFNAGRNMATNAGGHYGVSAAMTTTATGTIGGLCTPCHDPHGVSSTISTPANAVPLLKGTYVTSPYKTDVAPVTTQARGGGSKAPIFSGAYIAGYHIDQNTMQAARAMKPTAVKSSWLFTTSAKSLQNLTDVQSAGLCINCHTKATLNNSAAATTTNWKSMQRIHNSVTGWALTTGTAGNVGNKAHAYTCSKCHTPHNARLPRLLVTNCLDIKHLGRVLSQSTLPQYTAPSGVTNTSKGRGRFPGGGGGPAGIGTATNPGPWYFGSTAGVGALPVAATTCHQSGTAGGTTFNATSQQWNTKSLW